MSPARVACPCLTSLGCRMGLGRGLLLTPASVAACVPGAGELGQALHLLRRLSLLHVPSLCLLRAAQGRQPAGEEPVRGGGRGLCMEVGAE